MKRSLKILLTVISIFLVSAVMAQQKKVIYTCPMHPEVQMSKPGNCPKCGMTLEKKTITVKKAKAQKQPTQPSSQQEKKMPSNMQAKDTSMGQDHMQMDMRTDTTRPKMQMSDTSG